MRPFTALAVLLATVYLPPVLLAQSSPPDEPTGWVRVVDLAVDAFGNLYLGGSMGGSLLVEDTVITSLDAQDVFLAKYAPSGRLLWMTHGGAAVGDPSSEVGSTVVLGEDGSVYLAGTVSGSGMFNSQAFEADSVDIFAAKYTPAGETEWIVTAGGPGIDRGVDATIGHGEHLYLTGRYQDEIIVGDTTLAHNGWNILLARLTTAGDVEWVKNALGGNDVLGGHIAAATDGGVYLTGSYVCSAEVGDTTLTVDTGSLDPCTHWYGPQALLAKFDSTGAIEDARNIERATYTSGGAIVDASGAVYVAGQIGYFRDLPAYPAPGSLLILNKYDAAGEPIWSVEALPAVTEPASAGLSASDLSVDAMGNAYVVGDYVVQLDVGQYTFSEYAAKLDDTGAVVWTKRGDARGAVSSLSGTRIAADGTGSAYVYGNLSSAVNFGGYLYTRTDPDDPFIIKYTPEGEVEWVTAASYEQYTVANETEVPHGDVLVQQFPNPFRSATRLHFDIPRAMHVRLRVYDLTGREVALVIDQYLPAGPHEIAFDGRGLPSGTYLYRLDAEDVVQSGRMVLVR